MRNQKYITGYFTDEKELFAAIGQIQDKGLIIADVRTPFAVHGLDKLLKFKPSNISTFAFIAGLIGFAVGIGLQVVISTQLYPINYGGKPFLAGPSFMPVTVMLTFLFAAFGAALGFLMQSKLGAGAEAWIPDEATTDDRFLVIMDIEKGESETIDLLNNVGAQDVKLVEVNIKK